MSRNVDVVIGPASALSVIILTYNEEKHIARAIESAAVAASRIFVVDSFSTDRTLEIARGLGAIVVQNPFVNQSQQFQWALDNLPIETEWVMRLDADETLTTQLCDELLLRLPQLSPDITGVNIRRRHIFLHRWIKHGGRYPLVLLRVWRNRAAKVEQRWMDEHIVLLRGSAVTFDHDFSDDNLNDITFFIEKHNKYATREAIDRVNERLNLFPSDENMSTNTSNAQARLKRLIKVRFYNRLPFGFGPLGYFLWRYFFQLGFLDGTEGLIYHFLQGFWYRFLVESKVFELSQAVAHLQDPKAIVAELARLTKLHLE